MVSRPAQEGWWRAGESNPAHERLHKAGQKARPFALYATVQPRYPRGVNRSKLLKIDMPSRTLLGTS
jgi:hypothetical protein